MLPFAIPVGTSLAALVTTVVPEAHARLVPADAKKTPFVCALELLTRGRLDHAWVITIAGATMTARAGEAGKPDARLRASTADAQAFLDDWTGAQRYVPKHAGKAPPMPPSDPRVLDRLRIMQGVFELALRDFSPDGEPRRAALTIAVGPPAKKAEPDPDVVIETSTATYERLVSGAIGPEDALADGDVSVQGKRLLAVQLALALAPMFPR